VKQNAETMDFGSIKEQPLHILLFYILKVEGEKTK